MQDLVLIENFISVARETELLQHIKAEPGGNCNNGAMGSRNRVWRFGAVIYDGVECAIPGYLDEVAADIAGHRPNHVTVNEYLTGQSLDWHTDAPPCGEVISILSLLTDAQMRLRPRRGVAATTIDLPRRSLLQMCGETRWIWEHAVTSVPERRFSLVFRTKP